VDGVLFQAGLYMGVKQQGRMSCFSSFSDFVIVKNLVNVFLKKKKLSKFTRKTQSSKILV
jgi:hypothetical protein